MTPEQFCYWLQGFGELTDAPPSPEQWQSIKDHLETVFNKVTPKIPHPYVGPIGPVYPQPGIAQPFPSQPVLQC